MDWGGSMGGGMDGGGKGKGKSKEQLAAIPCRYFALGNCSRGAECWYSHDEEACMQALQEMQMKGAMGKADGKGKPKGGGKQRELIVDESQILGEFAGIIKSYNQ